MADQSPTTAQSPAEPLWPRIKLAINGLFLVLLLGTIVPVLYYTGAPKADPSRKVHLRFMTWGGPEQLEQAREINKLFLETHPDVGVELLCINQRYASKLAAMMASDETPDVFLASPGSIALYSDRVDPLLEDITPYVVEDMRNDPSRSADDPDRLDFSDILPQAVQTFYSNGRLYGLPRDYKSAGFGYNADMLAELGLEDPNDLYARNEWTWEKMLEYLKTCDRDVPGKDGKARHVFGMFQDSFSEGYWHNILLQAGGGIFTDDCRDVIIDRPESIRGLQFVRDLAWKYKVAKPFTPELGLENAWYAGQAATLGFRGWHVPMHINSTYKYDKATGTGAYLFAWDAAPWPLGPLIEGVPEPVSRDDKVIGYRIPSGRFVLPGAVHLAQTPEGKPAYRLRGVTATPIGFVMSASSNHKPEAWTLLKFLVSRRAQEMRASFRKKIGGEMRVLPGSDMPSRDSAVPFYLNTARVNTLRPTFTGCLEHKNRQKMWPNVQVFIDSRHYGRPSTGALAVDAVGREVDRQFQRMLLDPNVTPEEVAAESARRARIVYDRVRHSYPSSFNTPSLVRPREQDPLGLAP